VNREVRGSLAAVAGTEAAARGRVPWAPRCRGRPGRAPGRPVGARRGWTMG